MDKDTVEFLKSTAPIPIEGVPKFFEMLSEHKKESEMTKRELKKYDSMKEVMIQEITGKYSFYEFLFTKIFAERQEAMKKDFEIINEGMRRNDRNLIATGVNGLSQLLSSSPIADMEKIRRMLGHEKSQ